MRKIATIPADLCFVTTLASGLWRRAGGDPLALARTSVFLPTRRACRALREAFLRVTEASAVLLPRMQPLGDVDEVELDLFGAAAFSDFPPAISPLRRQMLLTRLVLKKDKTLPLDQAASLAASLGSLLDQAQTEGLSFAALQGLAPEEYARHWQETLKFLEIVTHAWPDILKAEGCLDPAERRSVVLDAQAQRWLSDPPGHPIIAAGSTGSVPAVGRLMGVISSLPEGEVILPGLDLSLDEESWQDISETHPQFTMKSWLDSLNVRRGAVGVWEGAASVRPARSRLFSEALRPAEHTGKWRDLTPKDMPPEAVSGLSRLDLDHHREEADVIALRLRAALEEAGRTAALVTPDRALAARVAAALGRWGIMADDSAGAPLSAWPVGSFLSVLLEAALPQASPVSYLALLKHPLAAAGVAVEECRARARFTEVNVWRGVRRSGGWQGAAASLRASAEKDEPVATWLDRIGAWFAPVTAGWHKERPLADHIEAHIALAEALAATPEESGAARLWRGAPGEAAASWLEEWREASADFPAVTGEAYARLFSGLMRQVTARPAYGQHPRLAILGPLEARLLHYDLVILGGLNEGVWPPSPPVDPWLSRPMKRAFGLPSPERRVGLSAHDFVQLASAGEVLLTRACRVEGAQAAPSRFLLQVETVLQAASAGPLTSGQPWREWARFMDAPERPAPMAPPRPAPPLAVRPRRLSVTEIGVFLRNPYAIYAKHVLRLRKLEDIDADVTAAEHGNVIHEALERFVARTLTAWPLDPLALLLEEGRRAFAPYADRPQVKAFWWPRFERIAAWFVEEESRRRAEGITPLAVEAKGEIAMLDGAFTLSGRADRLDRLADGSLAVIDYKTGAVPSETQVMAGYEPQLALLAIIAVMGGFKGIDSCEAGELSYWKLQGGEVAGKISSFTKELDVQQAKAWEGLEKLLLAFSREETPYEVSPKPKIAPKYDDYAHLARLAEWGRLEGGEE